MKTRKIKTIQDYFEVVADGDAVIIRLVLATETIHLALTPDQARELAYAANEAADEIE